MKLFKAIAGLSIICILFGCSIECECQIENINEIESGNENESENEIELNGTESDLETYQKKIIGVWEGDAIPPSNWSEPYKIEIEFKENGIYSARNTSSAGLPAFYYGTDSDSDQKVFNIYDLYANGQAIASITILFQTGSTNIGKLDFIELSNDYDQLTFDFWKGDYGPIKYTLKRK